MEDQSSVSLFIKIGILFILIAITYLKPILQTTKQPEKSFRHATAQ